MKVCPTCQREYTDKDAFFCHYCDRPLVDAMPAPQSARKSAVVIQPEVKPEARPRESSTGWLGSFSKKQPRLHKQS